MHSSTSNRRVGHECCGSDLGSARALACTFRRLAEMLLVQPKKVVGEAPTTAREGARAPRKRGVAGWSPQHKALRASCREYWTASSFHNFGDDEKIIGLSRCIA